MHGSSAATSKIRRVRGIQNDFYRGKSMKNAYKLLAAVAISAFIAVSASAFAADTNTAAAPAAKPAVHHHHHHHKMMCKKDKKGHCMHHMMMAPRAHDTWMGTPAAPAYHPHD